MTTSISPEISNATRITSARSLGEVGLSGQKQQADKVLDIVVAANRNGIKDMSLREIAKRWELVHGASIDVGTVSARVSNLVLAKRLVRVKGAERACAITGRTVHPVCAPATQAGMF